MTPSTEKINLDFQLFSIGDPKALIIIDVSTWSFIESKPAIIEIIVPGATKPSVYNLAKNQANVFNTSNLHMSPMGVYNDLPDGVYKVTIKGSPDTFCKSKDILKDDKTRLELYRLYASLGLEGQIRNEEEDELLRRNKLLIDGANAALALGKSNVAEQRLRTASENLRRYSECDNCNRNKYKNGNSNY